MDHVREEVLEAVVPAVHRLILVVDVDPRLRFALTPGLGVDLYALLGEETAHAAHEALALAQDDGVGAELGADLGNQVLELTTAVRPHAA